MIGLTNTTTDIDLLWENTISRIQRHIDTLDYEVFYHNYFIFIQQYRDVFKQILIKYPTVFFYEKEDVRFYLPASNYNVDIYLKIKKYSDYSKFLISCTKSKKDYLVSIYDFEKINSAIQECLSD